MLFYIQNEYFRRNNMTNATKRILEKKAQVEAKKIFMTLPLQLLIMKEKSLKNKAKNTLAKKLTATE